MHIHRGPNTSLARPRTAGLVETYLKAKENAGQSPKTIRGCRGLLRLLGERFNRITLDPDSLQAFIKGDRDYAPDTLVDRFSDVRTFYNWLVLRKVVPVDRNPFLFMIRPPRNRSPARRVLSLEQLRKVVEVTVAPFERALILTLVDSGPRIGELAGCTKDDLTDGTLRIYGKEAGRILPLTPDVFGYLQDLPTHNLFPEMQRQPGLGFQAVDASASVDALRRRVGRVLVRSGLTGEKLGPHILRHSYATHYVDRGGDLKSLSLILGHANTRMTEIYVTLALGSLKKKHAEFSVLEAVRGLVPMVSVEELPPVGLPPPAAAFPTYYEGQLVLLFLVADRRPNHTFYYIRAREATGRSALKGAKKWPVCSLGTDLPLNEVDALRQAIYRENQRRLAVRDIVYA